MQAGIRPGIKCSLPRAGGRELKEEGINPCDEMSTNPNGKGCYSNCLITAITLP